METIRYYIYQLPAKQFLKIHFLDDGADVSINLLDYCAVYTDTLMDYYSTREQLDYLFQKFNEDIPENFAGHSLSVGDIIKLETEHWLCCDRGWRLLKEVGGWNYE